MKKKKKKKESVWTLNISWKRKNQPKRLRNNQREMIANLEGRMHC